MILCFPSLPESRIFRLQVRVGRIGTVDDLKAHCDGDFCSHCHINYMHRDECFSDNAFQ